MNPALLTVALTSQSKVYDGTTLATLSASSFGVTGFVSGQGATINQTVGTYNSPNVGSASSVTSSLTAGNYQAASGTSLSNYVLPTSVTATASITPASLTVTANNDAKFVTQTDTVGYNNVSYSGFVGGQGPSVLGGTLLVTRSNMGAGNGASDPAGTYTGVLVPSGLISSNYSISYVNGNYTIVPVDQLLVKVSNTSISYRSSPTYTIASAQYLSSTNNTIASLTETSSSGNTSTWSDGAGGTVTFTLAPSGAVLSTTSNVAVGNYAITGTNTSIVGSNFSSLVFTGNLAVTPIPLTVSASNVSKTYDGTTSMNGVTIGLTGLVTNGSMTDAVTVNGVGAFSTKNAGTGLSYSVGSLTLAGADAGDYYLSGGTTISGTNGTITPKPVTLAPQSVTKTYDGTTSYTLTPSDLNYLSGLLGVTGDSVSAATLTFDNKNVGTGKTLAATAVTINDGNGGNNYAVTLGSNSTSSITQLNSVTWVGGSSGNWFNPTNWAGGAVPDLSNVANVVIPANTSVTFGTSVVAPAQTGQVNLTSLTDAGALNMTGGSLSVGSGGISLGGLTQTGGALSTSGNFSTTGSFNQQGAGTLTVGGTTQINASTAPVVLGNLTSSGSLNVVSTAGSVTQANGTTLSAPDVSMNASLAGTPADVVLSNAGNNLSGTFSATGNNIAVSTVGALQLGAVNATNNLSVDTGSGGLGGGVSQVASLNVGGTATFTADTSALQNADLSNAANQFNGPVVFNTQSGGTWNNLALTNASSQNPLQVTLPATANNVSLNSPNGGLNVVTQSPSTIAGNLTLNAGSDITQTGPLTVDGTTQVTSTNGNITLSDPANAFVGTVTATGNNVTLNDSVPLTAVLNATGTSTLTTTGTPGTLTVSGTTGNLSTTSSGGTVFGSGTTTVTGNLSATSVGDITQTGPLSVTGTSTFDSTMGTVDLKNPSNTFVGSTNLPSTSGTVVLPPSLTVATRQGDSSSSTIAIAPNSVAVQTTSVGVTTLADVSSTSPTSMGTAEVASPPAAPVDVSVSTVNGSGVVVTNIQTASPTQLGVVSVTLPSGSTGGLIGLVIQLPDEVSPLIASPDWKLTSAGNARLPSWLRFDPSNQSLVVVGAVPLDAFPLQLVGSASGMKVIIQISEHP